MTSSESYSLEERRECYRIKRFHAEHRDDYLLIRVNPLIDSFKYHLDIGQISEVIIATRHKGVSLHPITKWPTAVYVLRVLIKHPEERDFLKEDEMALIDLAEIYPTLGLKPLT